MYNKATGGSDEVTGGDNTGGGAVTNNLFGDASTMYDNSKGGNDTLTGGNNSGTGAAHNYLYGDAFSVTGANNGWPFWGVTCGNDTLIGGSASAGSVENYFYGDAKDASGAKFGSDVLIAGTAAEGGTVYNYMYGDAEDNNAGFGAADLFVFSDDGSQTVGTNNYIYDFSQFQNDRIEFSGVDGVHGFADLGITFNGGNTIIVAGSDEVTLVGFSGTLTANNFLFT